jgi:mRNA-degrading endonuclease toxin of MazEF toxin-antitoxin module
MPVSRGDVVLAFVEDVGAPAGKRRPALVVQCDRNNSRLQETIIAAITSNTTRVHEPHQFLIDIGTPEGKASGLLRNSAVRCERLHTVLQSDLLKTIGHLPPALMLQVDDCLKASLGIP